MDTLGIAVSCHPVEGAQSITYALPCGELEAWALGGTRGGVGAKHLDLPLIQPVIGRYIPLAFFNYPPLQNFLENSVSGFHLGPRGGVVLVDVGHPYQI